MMNGVAELPADETVGSYVAELADWFNGIVKEKGAVSGGGVERRLRASFAKAMDVGLKFEVDTGATPFDVRLWPVVIVAALLLGGLWFLNRNKMPVKETMQSAADAASSTMSALAISSRICVSLLDNGECEFL